MVSPFVKNLKKLNLMDNTIGDKGLILLSESESMSKLEVLNLENTGITSIGILALSQSSYLKNLQ